MVVYGGRWLELASLTGHTVDVCFREGSLPPFYSIKHSKVVMLEVRQTTQLLGISEFLIPVLKKSCLRKPATWRHQESTYSWVLARLSSWGKVATGLVIQVTQSEFLGPFLDNFTHCILVLDARLQVHLNLVCLNHHKSSDDLILLPFIPI